jgi:hypothetical protein
MKIVSSFTDMVDKGGLNAVFLHLRNLFYCSLIIAAGAYAHANPPEWARNIYADEIFGYPIIGIGAFLLLLNIADGIYKLSKLKHRVSFYILITLFYMLFAVRLVIIMTEFRMR